MVRLHGLRPREAAVLYALVSYAGADGSAWPSIGTLASDLGYRAKPDGTCSAVSDALRILRERGLITEVAQRSRQTTIRRLQYAPTALTSAPPSVTTEASPSVSTEEKSQEAIARQQTDCLEVPLTEEPGPPSVSTEGEKTRLGEPQTLSAVLEAVLGTLAA